MSKIHFADIPLVVRLTTRMSIFMAWVLFAEFVIDRYGFDRYLPFYRVGNVCPYELVAILAIVVFLVLDAQTSMTA